MLVSLSLIKYCFVTGDVAYVKAVFRDHSGEVKWSKETALRLMPTNISLVSDLEPFQDLYSFCLPGMLLLISI